MAQSSEQRYSFDLEVSRAADREIREISETAGDVIRPPSRLKFSALLVMAGILDLLDFLALTGIGLILTYTLKFLFAPVLFMAGVRANKRIKNMNKLGNSLEQEISRISRKLNTYSKMAKFAGQYYSKGLKLARRNPALRKPARRVAKQVSRARRAVRNPVWKNAAAIMADFIPLVDLFTWRTIGVYLIYRDEKKTYQEARPVVEEYTEARLAEVETIREEAAYELAASQQVDTQNQFTPETEPAA